MKINFVLISGVIASLTFLAISCSSGSSTLVSTSTTISSSNLSTSVSGLRREDSKVLYAVTDLNEAVNACPTGSTVCYTPSAVGGKFSGLSLRVGTDGTYYRLEIIEPPQSAGEDVEGDDPIPSANLNSFDFGAPTAISGTPECCSDITFNDSSSFKDLIWTVGWIDAKFPANTFGTGLPEATFRLVYFTDSTTGYQKGDILIKESGGTEFKFCPTGATLISQCSATRASVATPITQDTAIVNYTASEGSPVFPYLSAGVYDSSTGTGHILTSEASLLAGPLSFTVDFDHENIFAVEKDGITARTFATIFDVMPYLYLRGFSATPTGISVAGGMNAVLSVSTQ